MPDVSPTQVLLRTGLLVCAAASVGVVCFGQDAAPNPPQDNGAKVETPEETDAQEYVRLVEKKARLIAQEQYVPIDQSARAGPAAGDSDLEKDPARRWRQQAREAGRTLTVDSVRNFRDKLKSNGKPIKGQLTDLRTRLTDDRERLSALRLETSEAKGSKGILGKIVVLLDPKHLYFWLASLLATGGLTILVAHRKRHDVRRVLNGGAPRRMRLWIVLWAGVIGLVMITGVVVADYLVFKNMLYQKLVVYAADDPGGKTPLEQAQDDLKELKGDVKELESGLEDDSSGKNTAGQQQGQPPNAAQKMWSEISEIHRRLWTDLKVQEALFSEREITGKTIDTETVTRNKERDNNHDELASQKWVFPIIGVSVSTGMLVLATVFLWNLRNRQKEIEFTCPQCLAIDSLIEVGGNVGARNSQAAVLECENVIESVNDYQEESSERCGFESRPVYQQMPKLCLPTLGIPASGKTVWLAMLYRQLNLGNFPDGIHFEKIRSRSSEQLDRKVDDLLDKRLDPGATQTARLPSPLVFNFRDSDFWGKSNLLVNMFDYSGEVTSDRKIDHPHRKRALEGDGFVFLLDPTKSFEPQSNAVVEFREELRLIKGRKVGQTVRLPAAICVSKLDHKDVAEKLRGTSFYEDLKKIDPTGESLDLSVLEKRSQLMLEFRDTLWPGWKLEKQIDELLGGRYLFFPMTPYGLDEMGKELEDHAALTPFGILAPLLWLLHMNGYPVLSK